MRVTRRRSTRAIGAIWCRSISLVGRWAGITSVSARTGRKDIAETGADPPASPISCIGNVFCASVCAFRMEIAALVSPLLSQTSQSTDALFGRGIW